MNTQNRGLEAWDWELSEDRLTLGLLTCYSLQGVTQGLAQGVHLVARAEKLKEKSDV